MSEIVVTGSRIRQWEPEETPAVQIAHRADNLIVQVTAVNDTRVTAQRRTELIETLTSLVRAADARADIDVSIEDNGALSPLTVAMLETITLGVDGARADTSTATLTLKTPITSSDSLDAATRRLTTFIRGVQPTGRTLVTVSGEWRLSIVNPEQYRSAILTAVAADARRTASTFGDGYAAQVTGLAGRVAWRQSGPLDLSLFIPYQLTVTPSDSVPGGQRPPRLGS